MRSLIVPLLVLAFGCTEDDYHHPLSIEQGIYEGATPWDAQSNAEAPQRGATVIAIDPRGPELRTHFLASPQRAV